MKLRPYQEDAVSACVRYISTTSKPGYVVAPSASGKSFIVAGLAAEMNVKTLVFQPTREILEQNYEKYTTMYGFDAGVYSAGVNRKEVGAKTTFATIQSAIRAPELLQGVELVVVDECHLFPPDKKKGKGVVKSMLGKFLDDYNGPVVGLTATPTRLKTHRDPFSPDPYAQISKSNMLHRMRPRAFSDVIHVTQIPELIEGGYWCKPVYDVRNFDKEALRWNKAKSDYDEKSMKAALAYNATNKVAAEAAVEAHERGRKHILVFTTSIADAAEIVELLGPKAAMVSSKTPAKTRKKVLAAYKAGDITYMVNVQVLTVGYDFPELDCVVQARPTASYALYYQMICRGVRPAPGKKDVLVIDLVDNYSVFGPVEEMVVEDLPGYGWGIFLGQRIMTGVPIHEKKYVGTVAAGEKVIGRGKHVGKHPRDVPHSYLRYIYREWTRNADSEWLFKWIEEQGLAQLNDDTLMSFGRYGPGRGDHRKLKDVPGDYLMYLYDNEMVNSDLKAYIEDNLDVLQAEARN